MEEEYLVNFEENRKEISIVKLRNDLNIEKLIFYNGYLMVKSYLS